MKSGSKRFIQNLVCNFYTFLQVSTNFGSLTNFCDLKQLKKHLKSPAQYQAKTGPRLEPTGCGGLPRAVGQNAGWATA
jgi:hypothetical protein